MSTTTYHKRGTGFTRLLVIPSVFSDGYFIGWTVTSQVRDETGNLLSDCVCTWLDLATTRNLKIRVADTSAWPVDKLVSTDVRFVRDADGEDMQTTTATFKVVKQVTQ